MALQPTYTQLNKDSRGLTLVEMVVYISLASVLLLAVSSFFVMSTGARVKNQSVAEVNQQGEFAMAQIVQALRNGSAIALPATAASGSSLNVTMPAAGVNPTIFSLSGSVLQIKEGASAAVPLTSNLVQVSNLAFVNLTRPGTPGVVRVSFTMNRTKNIDLNQYDYQRTFTTTVSIRP